MLEKDKTAFLKGISKRDQGYWGSPGWVAVLNWVVRGSHIEKGKEKTYENRKERGWRAGSESDLVRRAFLLSVRFCFLHLVVGSLHY